MHNEINAWQHFLNLLYKESLMRNVTETFLQVLSAPVTTGNEEKKTLSEASVSHPEGAGERVWQHDLPTNVFTFGGAKRSGSDRECKYFSIGMNAREPLWR